MKAIIVPYWMKVSLAKSGKSLNDVLNPVVLETMFSKRDVMEFALINRTSLTDTLNPYLSQVTSRSFKLDKLLEPVNINFTVIEDTDLNNAMEYTKNTSKERYELAVIGRALPESAVIYFNCMEVYSESLSEVVLLFIANVALKNEVTDERFECIDTVFKILYEHGGHTFQELSSAGMVSTLFKQCN